MKNNIVIEKKLIINCPCCGRQYLPAEIYYPDSFLGKPMHIDKNENGEIEFFSGKNMDLTETYTCDKCKTRFKVNASISFSTEQVDDGSFSEVYIADLFKDKIDLDENF